jgi:hypothetical protein
MRKKLVSKYGRITLNRLPTALKNCRPTGRIDRGDNKRFLDVSVRNRSRGDQIACWLDDDDNADDVW